MALTIAQIKHSLHLTKTIEKLQGELAKVLGGVTKAIGLEPAEQKPRKKKKMSAAGRKAIADAQKARWAKQKAASQPAPAPQAVKAPKASKKKAAAPAKAKAPQAKAKAAKAPAKSRKAKSKGKPAGK